jgi:hypothetical protein
MVMRARTDAGMFGQDLSHEGQTHDAKLGE